MVERTVFDLDTDMLSIVKREPYKPRYAAVTILNEHLKTLNLDSLNTYNALKSGHNKVYRDVSTSSELNTYGYVLMSHKRMAEAEYIFKINRYLFPFNPNARDSYGEALLKNGKLEESKKEYMEGLRINPYNKNAIKELATINETLKNKKEEKSY